MSVNASALIVEDSTAIRNYIQAILSTDNWFDNIVHADSVDAAIKILDRDDHNISWVFSDSDIEGTPSQALLDHIRERYDMQQMQFVMLTDIPQTKLPRERRSPDINEYLSKPFEPNNLLNILRRHRGLPERRVAERVVPNSDCNISIIIAENDYDAEIMNLSASGCLVSMARVEQAGGSVYDVVSMQLELGSRQLQPLEAEIVRIEKDKQHSSNQQKILAALNFLDVSPDSKTALSEYIQQCDIPA